MSFLQTSHLPKDSLFSPFSAFKILFSLGSRVLIIELLASKSSNRSALSFSSDSGESNSSGVASHSFVRVIDFLTIGCLPRAAPLRERLAVVLRRVVVRLALPRPDLRFAFLFIS